MDFIQRFYEQLLGPIILRIILVAAALNALTLMERPWYNQNSVKKRRGPEIPGNRAVRPFLDMLVKGIEPPAYALRVRCSTPELHQREAFLPSNKKYYTTLKRKRKPFFSTFTLMV